MGDRSYEELVNTIYEGLIDPVVLEGIPALLANYCRARSAAIILWRTPTQLERTISTSYFPDDYWVDYQKYFGNKDVWAQRISQLPPNQAHIMDRYVSRRKFVNGEFYTDLVRGHDDDTAHCLAAWLTLPNGGMCTVGLHRGLKPGEFTDMMQQRLQQTLPHFRRLMTILQTMNGSVGESRLTEQILDSLATAIFVLDRKGAVVYSNPSATRILNRHDGLAIHAGLLTTHEKVSASKLQEMVSSLVLAPATVGTGALPVERLNGGKPYYLVLAPLREESISPAGKVLVLLQDPDTRSAGTMKHLASLFGLTEAEANLTMQLAEGQTLEEIALIRNVAMSTVRAQTKSVLAKTDTSRQAELVSVVSRLPGIRQ